MKNKLLSADEIYIAAMSTLVPLNCQERYARQLASLLSMHLKRSTLIEKGFPAESLPFCSAVVISETGQGISFILRQMAKAIGANVIIVDASTLAKERWKGTTLGQRLLAARESSNDLNIFRKSILFIDEIDKIHFDKNKWNSGNPMDNFLQLFDAGTITVEGNNHSAVIIDISQFTIICAGAFDGLESIVAQRIRPRAAISFMQTEERPSFSKSELLRMATMEDLEAYGFMPELLGRISTILHIDPMGVEDYQQLLLSDQGSICWKYSNYLKACFGIDLEITNEAVQIIAEDCMKKGGGACAAHGVTQRWMQEALLMVERDDMICKIVLDAIEGHCFLRYELGSRTYTMFREKSKNQKLFVMKAAGIEDLSEQLCQFYRKNGGQFLFLPELRAFLNCSLYYLWNHSDEGSFVFESVETLVQTLRKKNGTKTSTFDMLIKKELVYYREDAQIEQMKSYHQQLQEFDSPWLSYRLTKALYQIMDQITCEYGDVSVEFMIE